MILIRKGSRRGESQIFKQVVDVMWMVLKKYYLSNCVENELRRGSPKQGDQAGGGNANEVMGALDCCVGCETEQGCFRKGSAEDCVTLWALQTS